MAFLLNDDQRQIADLADRALAETYSGNRLKDLLESSADYDRAFWALARDLGWTALGVPEAFGGLGLGLIEQGLVSQACGRAVCGAPFLPAHYVAARAIDAYGDAALKDDLLPAIARGDRIFALALGTGGGEIPVLSGGAIDGAVGMVTGGAVADVLLVAARTADGPGLALVVLDDRVTRRVRPTLDNSRCVADLSFDRVPVIATLDVPNALEALWDLRGAHAVALAHEQVGGAERMLAMARDYALERRAFGQPIGAFQSVKHRIAEIYVQVELARAAAQGAAGGEGSPAFGRAAAAARLIASTAYESAARDAIQVHGALGVTWESDLHLHQRRARALALDGGSSLFWEDRLADLLARGEGQ